MTSSPTTPPATAAPPSSPTAGSCPTRTCSAHTGTSPTSNAATTCSNPSRTPTRGPLTAAAEAFARAGRDRHYRIPSRSDTGAALRTAGRLIGLLTPHTSRHGTQLAALTAALAALAAAVADLRTTQQRLHQADAALAAAHRLRPTAPRHARPDSAAALAGLSTATTTRSQRLHWPWPTTADRRPHHPAGRWPPPRQPGRGPTR